jgi:type III secretion protein O
MATTAYPLGSLVRVREYREQKASDELRKAIAAVEDAKKRLEAAIEALNRYRAWRIEEEERLMQTIMHKPVSVGRVGEVRAEIVELREAELQYVDAKAQAETALAAAIEARKAAAARYKAAVQAHQKLLRHQERWEAEYYFLLERAAEAELEEFQTKGPNFR